MVFSVFLRVIMVEWAQDDEGVVFFSQSRERDIKCWSREEMGRVPFCLFTVRKHALSLPESVIGAAVVLNGNQPMGSGVHSGGGPKVHMVTLWACVMRGGGWATQWFLLSAWTVPLLGLHFVTISWSFSWPLATPCALEDLPVMPYLDDIIMMRQTLWEGFKYSRG